MLVPTLSSHRLMRTDGSASVAYDHRMCFCLTGTLKSNSPGRRIAELQRDKSGEALNMSLSLRGTESFESQVPKATSRQSVSNTSNAGELLSHHFPSVYGKGSHSFQTLSYGTGRRGA